MEIEGQIKRGPAKFLSANLPRKADSISNGTSFAFCPRSSIGKSNGLVSVGCPFKSGRGRRFRYVKEPSKQGNGPDRSVNSRPRYSNPLQGYRSQRSIYMLCRQLSRENLCRFSIGLLWVTERQVCNVCAIYGEEDSGAFYAGGRK